ncbi:MAG: DNA polymerase III subunit epsilon, partial [Hyphomicrobium sp.]
TLALARRKHPAGPNTLDALCKRYGVDNSKRTKHGALIDCLLLADVYVELLGERQAALGLQSGGRAGAALSGATSKAVAKQRPQMLPSRVKADDVARHKTFVAEMGAKAIWQKFWQ